MQTLTILYLQYNQIGDKGAQYLGDGLQKNTVREKDLHDLHLYHIHLYHFIQTLTELYLGNNQIGAKGAEYLGEGLQKNTVRERITRSSSLLFHTDAHYTLLALQSNRSSRCTISWRRITKEQSETENNTIFIGIIFIFTIITYRHSKNSTCKGMKLELKVHNILLKD
jgi:hypothetical protein